MRDLPFLLQLIEGVAKLAGILLALWLLWEATKVILC